MAKREFALIALLGTDPGRAFSKDEIGGTIWGRAPDGRPAVDDNTIHNLVHLTKKAIEPDPKRPIFLINVQGFGYRLENAG